MTKTRHTSPHRHRAGHSGRLGSGTYQDPRPAVAQDVGSLTIYHVCTTRDVMRELIAGTPRFDLVLGTGQPYALTIQAASIEADTELGGLPITRRAINQRAGQSRVGFGQATHNRRSRCRSVPKGRNRGPQPGQRQRRCDLG